MGDGHEHKCEKCVHFRRHYIMDKHMYYQPISDGHCVYPRLKSRKNTDKACEHFEVKEELTEPRAVVHIRCSLVISRER